MKNKQEKLSVRRGDLRVFWLHSVCGKELNSMWQVYILLLLVDKIEKNRRDTSKYYISIIISKTEKLPP